MVVFNETLTVPSNPENYIYLTSFNTSGFRYACLMAKAQGSWQVGASISIWLYDNNFGIQTWQGVIALELTGNRPTLGSGYTDEFKLHSTSTDLYLQVHNSNVGFDGLLTIVVYLSN